MSSRISNGETLSTLILAASQRGEQSLRQAVDAAAAPAYLTDDQGVVIHFNTACIDFAGRMPSVGVDRWCVTWRLFSDTGAFIPHEICPMARAVQTKRPVRGTLAIALRPDGTQRAFLPFPTPIFREDGTMVAALNIFIDVTEMRAAADLYVRAQQCRRLAKEADDATTKRLLQMAADYETQAEALDG